MNDIRPFHYYLFSFNYHWPEGQQSGSASCVAGFRFKNKITLPLIDIQKERAVPGVPKNRIVVMSVSYLGQMHKDELEEGQQ